ncbi:REP-associated tyrosine transposase [Reichenbachiella sp.]|uniref:REP-associated tyrosine transposase n=1 Tax=Reichenbachiella sp. TaxID=2184521 RepID=UPI003B59A152
MANRYKIRDNEGLYFVTFTIVGWVDLFVRRDYRDCLIDSLNYCVKEKGLNVHAYVIMTSHLHMIVSTAQGHDLVSTIRDFKKFTSKSLIRLIKEIPESRREWMLNKFSYEANRTQRGSDYILWKEGYHAKQIETNGFLDEKLDYIHNNPVEAGFVSEPEEYLYSSARNYAGKEAVMNVNLL